MQHSKLNAFVTFHIEIHIEDMSMQNICCKPTHIEFACRSVDKDRDISGVPVFSMAITIMTTDVL